MNFTIEQKEEITKYISRIRRKLNRSKYLANLDKKNGCYFGADIEEVIGICQNELDKLKEYLMNIDER